MEVLNGLKTRVYRFGNKTADGNSKMKNLLGGKGANLAEMSAIGIPVPPGFTITTEVCTEYNQVRQRCSYRILIKEEVEQSIANIETQMGATFGDKENPLFDFSAFWSQSIYARNDGYCFKP
jgi:pyruvate,orthophosphate dikinase